MRRATSADLLFVSKSTKNKVENFAAGADLVKRTGYEIDELVVKATLDRLDLSRVLLLNANLAFNGNPPMYRVAVSRGYYAMYHCLRATAFFYHKGDDHEQHTVLQSKLPRDLPNRDDWANSLKSARLERNRADYDPYPRTDGRFKQSADYIINDAEILLDVARKYLRRKGCKQ